MQHINSNFFIRKKDTLLALGAESAGNFSVFKNGNIFLSDEFGDLLEEKNWQKFQKEVLRYLKDNKIKPSIILADLHPLFKTTFWGQELAKKFGAKFIQVQHHHAHIFSAIGDKLIFDSCFMLHASCFGIAMDGTGFGMNEKIWGGEVFEIKKKKEGRRKKEILRIGHLENQIMLGGDLTIKEPARMLIGILYKVFSNSSSPFGRGCRVLATGEGKGEIQCKKNIYNFVKKYYTKNQFELLYNQLQQNFNCQETSSAGRILDAVSILLNFSKNERKYKHESINLLEKNSTTPCSNLKPKIIFDEEEKIYILQTTPLFEYLVKNIKKDKKRLSATAQLYIAKGLYEIIKMKQEERSRKKEIFISGGLANNKIISSFLESRGAYETKKIPRGDVGLSFGQIVYYLLK